MASAADFLRVSLAILEQPNAMLWITAQGQFSDPRIRPTRLRSGVSHLARRLKTGCIVPLALEYPFWGERTAEALCRFGEPVRIEQVAPLGTDGWTQLIERSLETTQDQLSADAQRMNPSQFEILVSGKAGVGGVYELFCRMKAAVRGQRFYAAHDNNNVSKSTS